MTEEQMQAKILEHENTITQLNNTITTHTETLKNKESELDMLNSRIKELKDHNLSLFTKLTTTPQQEQPKQQQPEAQKLENILNTMLAE